MAAMTHTLLEPILLHKRNQQTGDVDVEELKPAGFAVTMRRPKSGDMKAFDRHGDAGIAAMIEMIASCSNLTTIEAENLDAVDFDALGNLLDRRGQSSPPTGSSA